MQDVLLFVLVGSVGSFVFSDCFCCFFCVWLVCVLGRAGMMGLLDLIGWYAPELVLTPVSEMCCMNWLVSLVGLFCFSLLR